MRHLLSPWAVVGNGQVTDSLKGIHLDYQVLFPCELSKTQQIYVEVNKEMLAIVSDCEQLHEYIYEK